MNVSIAIPVITSLSAASAKRFQSDDVAVFLQKIQIPINRRNSNIRQPLANKLEDIFSGRVAANLANLLKNNLPLLRKPIFGSF